MPPMRTGLPAELEFDRHLFFLSVAGHDCFRGLRSMLLGGAELLRRVDDSLADILHRQIHADPAGGTDQNRARLQLQDAFDLGSHLAGIGQPLFAGAGIGVAGIHHHGLGAAFPDAFNAELYRARRTPGWS